jgi:adenosylcobinamide kinase / adenosylcobinamide-phosphate guanylyltransferase
MIMGDMDLKQIAFVIGGCRSGKSGYALRYADSLAADAKIFLATCQPEDDEMRLRVKNHQKERGDNWQAIEVPLDLPEAILEHSRTGTVILADCLTMWISNLMMAEYTTEAIEAKIDALCAALENTAATVVLVSNEVGTGIVPENALARAYRDLVGTANQRMAAVADMVVITVAGIGVTIKPSERPAL